MSSRTLACGDCMTVLAVYEEGQEPGPIEHECRPKIDLVKLAEELMLGELRRRNEPCR